MYSTRQQSQLERSFGRLCVSRTCSVSSCAHWLVISNLSSDGRIISEGGTQGSDVACGRSPTIKLNVLPSFKEAIGWKLTDTGTLRATRTNSQAPWSVEAVVPKNQTVDHVQVFVVREDTNKTRSATAPLLQVKAIIGGDGDREYSVEVQATHNSDARVALPVRIDVQPPATAGVQIRLELRLIKGETVDIEGVFAC
jgi:hypothetical protein